MTAVVIAAGGTAGHVVPALAVADELRASGVTVSFVGTQVRAEAELVPAAGYEIDFLDVRGLDRRNPLRAAGAAARAAWSLRSARELLRRREAAAVLGGGGYVAGPVGLAALGLGVPLVLTEADSHLGLANRMLARRARRVCLAFPLAGREAGNYRVTGRPIPADIVTADRAAARERFGIPADARCVLVFGGSLGARSINLAAAEGLAGGDAWVLHLTGRRDAAIVAGTLGDDPERYVTRAYEPGLADALAAADLVVARSGGSIFEVAAAGRPAILIPYPHATADHQTANARWMTEAGAAVVIDDAALDAETLAAEVGRLLGDPERLAAMGEASRRIARPGAAKAIAGEVLAAVERRR